jgi:hypothetical protein
MENEMRKDIDRIKNFGKFINENVEDSFTKISKMKEKYDELINNYVTKEKASEEIRRMSNGGYENGEYGYPVVYFVGDYCLVLGSGIYKKV